jgi:hypothetical protein
MRKIIYVISSGVSYTIRESNIIFTLAIISKDVAQRVTKLDDLLFSIKWAFNQNIQNSNEYSSRYTKMLWLTPQQIFVWETSVDVRTHVILRPILLMGPNENYHTRMDGLSCTDGRSQWPRGLRHELSFPARTLWSWVRTPLKPWVFAFILCLCCPVYLATGWSPVQRVLRSVYRIKKLKIGQGIKCYRAVEKGA